MADSLSDMIKNGPSEEPVVFSDVDLDVPEQTTDQANEEEHQTEETLEVTDTIDLACMSDWFDGNVANFPDIRKPRLTITGVDPTEQLLVTIPVECETDQEKREMVLLNNIHIRNVLNIPATDMQIYSNNNYRIIYNLGNGTFIKCYGTRASTTSLTSVFCNDIDGLLVPHALHKTKKSDDKIEIITRDPEIVRQKLTENVDIEALNILYKQSSKAIGIATNHDAITWLLGRQIEIKDVNHHIQIDNAIITMLE